jgi:hypothetical protein
MNRGQAQQKTLIINCSFEWKGAVANRKWRELQPFLGE